MFSKTCEYGIKAMLYITIQSIEGRKVRVNEIAENSGSPAAFTAKILGLLTRHQIVNSHTGPKGGFFIESEKLNKLKLSEIVSAIDGNSVYEGCGLGLNYCDAENPCPLHNNFVKIRTELKEMLETTSVYDLAMKLKKGESVLIRLI